MKQYTSKDQTAKLIELGFPKPNSIESVDTEFDGAFAEHTIYNLRYSIGELIEFLESNIDINTWYHAEFHYWYVDFNQQRVGIDKELIDSLYFACVELKKQGII